MSYRNVIDNREYFLRDRVNLYAEGARELKFAIGYFYLNGFNLMKKAFQNADSIKLIMGRRTDRPTKEALVKGYEDDIERLDDEDDIKHITELYELIQAGKVEVKIYTDEILHSKLYLFKYGAVHPNLAIVGSSNLSVSGLTSNTELNVEVNDRERTNYLEEWFEVLWEEAEPFKKELLDVIESSKIAQHLPTPKLANPAEYTARYIANKLKYIHTIGSTAALGNFDPFYFQLQDANEIIEIYEQAIEKRGILLGHEVGLGKTIITGIALNELIARGAINRILITAPTSLLGQWKTEMDEKFNKNFQIIDSEKRNEHGPNVWKEHDRIIASIDFLKRHVEGDGLDSLKWDFLVVDESHYLRNRNTIRHTELKKIPADFKALLTATPIHNEEDDVFTQISLFHPDVKEGTKTEIKFLDKDRTLKESLIRRLRDDIQEFREILPDRELKDVKISINTNEAQLYQDFLQYISEDSYYYRLLSKNLEYIAPLVKFIFLKEFCSSSKAFLKGLRNLRQKIEQTIAAEKIVFEFDENQSLEEEIESLKEDLQKETDDIDISITEEGFIVEIQLNEDDLQKLREEVKQVNKFQERTLDIEPFTKENKLIEQVEVIRHKNEKAVVFVDFVPTGEELTKRLNKKGIKTAFFKGDLSKTERKEIIERLHSDAEDRIDVMVATDAGGLGLNLQAANHVFNYDLSWNPMVVEQRIGRVHRIGQRRTVFVHNLFNADTVEEHLNEVLAGKSNLIKETVGMSGEVIAGFFVNDKEFIRALIEYETREITKGEYEAKVTQLIEKSKEYRDKLDGLKTIPTDDTKEIESQRKETESQIKNLIDFFLKNEEIPYTVEKGIYQISNTEYGGPYNITFDRKKAASGEAEFASISHPLFEAIIEKYGSGEFGTPSAKKISSEGELEEYKGKRGVQYNFIVTYVKKDGEKTDQQKHHPITILGKEPNTDEEFNDLINAIDYEKIEPDINIIEEYEDLARNALEQVITDEKSHRINKIKEELRTRFENRLEKKQQKLRSLIESQQRYKQKLKRYEGKSWEELKHQHLQKKQELEDKISKKAESIKKIQEELEEMKGTAQEKIDAAKENISVKNIDLDSVCILEVSE